jgi:hypothetical protein
MGPSMTNDHYVTSKRSFSFSSRIHDSPSPHTMFHNNVTNVRSLHNGYYIVSHQKVVHMLEHVLSI